MKMKLGIGLLMGLGIVLGFFYWFPINTYQTEGKIQIQSLQSEARVIRDEKGMAYVYAENLDDVLKVQGYVMAQDRFFQMTLTKLMASGRISELAGKETIALDTRMRTFGFYRNAKKHVTLLNEETRKMLEAFAQGVNAFVEHSEELHLEFRLAGLTPEQWLIEDSIAIMYYMGWNSASNMKAELLAQMIVDQVGMEGYQQILPIHTNPDDELAPQEKTAMMFPSWEKLSIQTDRKINAMLQSSDEMRIGSNGWAMSSARSAGQKPIVASDPHLDTRILPGTLYPIGLITKEIRAVGATVAGIPGILIGRNQYLANGITYAYGDAKDVYIEQIDPTNSNHYLEGEQSIPFTMIEETIRYRSADVEGGLAEEKVTIRLTKRGPVISDVVAHAPTDKVLTVRWAAYEAMQPSLGLDYLLKATSVLEMKEILRNFTMGNFNLTFADIEGNIAWQTTGRVPIRQYGDGSLPTPVKNQEDHWERVSRFEEMPQQYGAKRGWIGNANHNTVLQDNPLQYSSYFSARYRYSRLVDLLDTGKVTTVEEHWKFQRDTFNSFAQRVAPFFAEVLLQDHDTKEMGKFLQDWNFHDEIDSVAALIFQELFRNVALETFRDELGEELVTKVLDDWNFWQERFEKMMVIEDHAWIDDQRTNTIESKADIILRGAKATQISLQEKLGTEMQNWTWGRLHTITFLNPIRRKGFGTEWVGGRTDAMGGSGETLYRATYKFNEPYQIRVTAALRMVADLSDPDKVLAVMGGGVVGRTFSAHQGDQIDSYLDGTKEYWWFSDEKIKEYQTSELTFHP